MNDDDLEALLATAIDTYRQLPPRIPVGTAIEAMTRQRVVPFVLDRAGDLLAVALADAARRVIERSVARPFAVGRVNELGNAVEEPLLDACRTLGLDAKWPKRGDGSGGRSGYPDLAIDVPGGGRVYLEAKVIAAGSETSSFRSFYLSPSDNPKVSAPANHLLVAFTHQRCDPAVADGLERYRLTSFTIVDLARVHGRIKFEYQASNRDLYAGDAVISRGG